MDDPTTINHPLVSIIIPVYNLEAFIGDALDSIAAQTYKNFQVLIVDDGSTDGTQKVIERYLMDSRFRYIYQDHSGPGAARNNALRQATGSLIAFLDGDDLWLNDKLEKQVAVFMADSSIEISATNCSHIREDGSYMGREEYVDYPFELLKDPKKAMFQKNLILSISVMIRKELYDKFGGFDESISYGEDYDLWLRFLQNGCKLNILMEPLSKRRYRSGSLIHQPLHIWKTPTIVYDNAIRREKTRSGRRILKKWRRQVKSSIYAQRALTNLPAKPIAAAFDLLLAWLYQPWRLRSLSFGMALLMPSFMGGSIIRKRVYEVMNRRIWHDGV